MNASAARLAFGLLVAGALVGSAPGAAQYGTSMYAGDPDHYPATTAASLALSVNEEDFGQAGTGMDNCLVLDTSTTATAGATRNDIRITPCFEKGVGTQITDSDAGERAAAYPRVAAVSAQYFDKNQNNRFDKGDPVYFTSKANAGLAATGATGSWSVLVTPVGNYTAGSFVQSVEDDFTAYGRYTVVLTASVASREDGSSWLIPKAAGYAAGSMVPSNSLRLLAASYKAQVETTGINATTKEPAAGEPFRITIDVKNSGKLAGAALIEVKMGNETVDARGSPYLGAGESTKLVATVFAPKVAGPTSLTSFKAVLNLTVKPNEGKAVDASRIAMLEAQVAELRGDHHLYGMQALDHDTKKVPAATFPVIFVLALVGFLWVRRGPRQD